MSDQGVNHNGRYGKEERVADGGSEEREQFPNAACLSDHHPTNILFTMNEERFTVESPQNWEMQAGGRPYSLSASFFFLSSPLSVNQRVKQKRQLKSSRFCFCLCSILSSCFLSLSDSFTND